MKHTLLLLIHSDGYCGSYLRQASETYLTLQQSNHKIDTNSFPSESSHGIQFVTYSPPSGAEDIPT